MNELKQPWEILKDLKSVNKKYFSWPEINFLLGFEKALVMIGDNKINSKRILKEMDNFCKKVIDLEKRKSKKIITKITFIKNKIREKKTRLKFLMLFEISNFKDKLKYKLKFWRQKNQI